MKNTFMLFLLIVASGYFCARGQDLKKSVPDAAMQRYCSMISAAVPGSGEEVRRLVAQGNVKEAQEKILNAASQTRKAACDQSSPWSDRLVAAKGYSASWQLLLDQYHQSHDERFRRGTLAAWDSGLEDPVSFALQVRALTCHDARPFLDDNFWNAFQETGDLTVLFAVCALMNSQGSLQDVPHLEEKIKRTKDEGTKSYLQLAIRWIQYHQHHSSWDPGPASTGPVMPDESEIIKKAGK